QAMSEQCYTEPDSGQPLCGSLMDYGLPRADTLPSFAVEIAEVLSPTNPLGIKAGGEGGTTAAPAVVISAIVDALARYGVRNLAMPATPFNVWKAIQEAKTGTHSVKRQGTDRVGKIAQRPSHISSASQGDFAHPPSARLFVALPRRSRRS